MNSNNFPEFEELLRQHALSLAQQGVEALESLYHLVAGRLLRYLIFLTSSAEESEDILQASMLRLARYPRKLAGAQNPWTYLLKLVRHEAYTHHSRKKALKQPAALPVLLDPRHGSWDQWERLESVHKAMKQLPAVQAEVVSLKIWEGLTFREIAEITEESLPTVSSRYRYAIEKLAVLLKAFDETESRSLFDREAIPTAEDSTADEPARRCCNPP